MPTYEYLCRVCGKDLEAVQAFTDDPLTVCPSCGGELRKVFSSVGISFKGSGFYKNDSRPAKTPDKPASTATPETTTPAAAPETKTGGPAPTKTKSTEKATPAPAAIASKGDG